MFFQNPEVPQVLQGLCAELILPHVALSHPVLLSHLHLLLLEDPLLLAYLLFALPIFLFQFYSCLPLVRLHLLQMIDSLVVLRLILIHLLALILLELLLFFS